MLWTAYLERVGISTITSYLVVITGCLDMTILTHAHCFLSSIMKVLLFDQQLWMAHLSLVLCDR